MFIVADLVFLNIGIFTAFKHSFETNIFQARLFEIYLSIKDLENFAENNLLQNLHLCTQYSVSATIFGYFGEIGAIFSLHVEHSLLKLNIKSYRRKSM